MDRLLNIDYNCKQSISILFLEMRFSIFVWWLCYGISVVDDAFQRFSRKKSGPGEENGGVWGKGEPKVAFFCYVIDGEKAVSPSVPKHYVLSLKWMLGRQHFAVMSSLRYCVLFLLNHFSFKFFVVLVTKSFVWNGQHHYEGAKTPPSKWNGKSQWRGQ